MDEVDIEQEEAPSLLANRRKLLEAHEEALENSLERVKKEKPSLGCASDVIQLNVGGSLMTTLRRTLTYVEDSMLAARFSGRWDESIEKDKYGIFFIDQPLELFLPMIDFIRSQQNQTSSVHAPESPNEEDFSSPRKYRDFKRMVKYYGVTPGIFPVKLVDYSTGTKKRLAMSGPSSSFQVDLNEWKICKLAPLQIGWVHGSIINTAVSGQPNSIALDLVNGAFTCIGALEMVDQRIQSGTFVNSSHYGKKWFIDGEEVFGNWKDTWKTADAVPVVSGKGEWTITAVELEP